MKKGCDHKVEVFSRIVGFWRPVQLWNKGKKEEYKDRKKFQFKKGKLI